MNVFLRHSEWKVSGSSRSVAKGCVKGLEHSGLPKHLVLLDQYATDYLMFAIYLGKITFGLSC